MRQIGHLPNENSARVFGDYLFVKGVENQVEHDGAQGWIIWVRDDALLDRGRELLAEFRADPADPRFRRESREAAAMRESEAKSLKEYRRKVKGRGQLFRTMAGYGFGPLTFVLIVITVAVFILSNFSRNFEPVRGLFITEETGHFLTEIRHGQVWRLLTPIFLHFGFLHIFFNLLWLRDLGSMIEARQGPWMLALLVVVIGVLSNFGQYLMGSTPIFGGMSGVNYGLIGYIWMRGKFDPASGLYLHPYTIAMMVIWFFVCLSGYVGGVANTAHAVGFGVGLAWGYLSSLRRR